MVLKRFPFCLVLLAFSFAGAGVLRAQDPTATQPPTLQDQPDPQQQQQEKAKTEKKATTLLEQVIAEAQSLKLPENRIRVQITAADMLWDRSQGRARGLFTEAGAGIAQLTVDVDHGDRGEIRGLAQLRQELVLTAARHDADLAYQLLRTTQSQTPDQNAGGRRGVPQGNLDQSLMAAVAATDPKVAYQKAVESLDKGEYPTSLSRVLAQLKVKDKDDFKKLSDKALGKLGSDALLSNRDAGNLALSLLRLGPGPDSTADTSTGDSSGGASATPAAAPATNGAGSAAAANNNSPVLSQSAFHDLMDATITAAMSATPLAPGANNFRGGRGGPRGVQTTDQQSPPDAAQVQQSNARTLLMGLQSMLPQIDQYLPDRAQSVRQKATELGLGNNQMAAFGQQMRTAMQGGNSDSLLAAANVAPPQIQSRLYQQAALKAVDEGNTDKATQIATDHLDETTRASVMQAVDIKKMATTASPEKLGEIRAKLASLPSDADRVKFLIALAAGLQKDNPKLALRFLDDAKTLVSKRATDYKDFEQQLAVADAYSTLDPKRSFDVLEPGIAQLNELLSAAAVLNGFEVDIFKDGELPLRGNNDLSNMVARYGQELASLSKVDFEQAKTTADRFQLAEPRLLAKLSIVQSMLGVQPAPTGNTNFGGAGRIVYGPRGQ